ncbi:MAG: tyrosine-type recombinase/integrase [Acidimicrobiales bacterium]|nr:tyrosine-type recombinase/integrase [Acidimicrobiales bacterium]
MSQRPTSSPERAVAFGDWLTGQGRAANTVAAYRRDVAAYLRWRDNSGGAALADYVEELRATRRPSSAARAIVALRIYHRWVGESQPVPELKGVPLADEPEGDELTEADIERLLAAARGDTVERRRDAVAIALLYFAGLKASEAISLDLSDITADEALLTVDRDGPHERVLPAVPALRDALRRWLDVSGRDRLQPTTDAVLVNRRGQRLTRQGLWLLTGGVAKRAEVAESLSPNALRRACTAHLTERGLPGPAVAAFLGHTARKAPGAGMLNETGWGSCNLPV